MKLESLKLDKFKDNALKKEQMFMLNAGRNERTGSGSTVANHSNMGMTHFNYGYDVIRWNSGGQTTFHNRTLVHAPMESCDYIAN